MPLRTFNKIIHNALNHFWVYITLIFYMYLSVLHEQCKQGLGT
jgi:hypothetical protein